MTTPSGSSAAKASAKVVGAAKGAFAKAVVSKAAFAGGTVAAIAGRRALWPAFVLGSVFSGAAWFGTFELAWSASKMALPLPLKPDPSAQTLGLVTLPITTASSIYLGWRTCPQLAPPPESLIDFAGLLTYLRSVPAKHIGIAGASSAVMAALTCRMVQYRGGA